MELRDIEYFAVIAEHRNLRRAAEALELSQPALSKSLRRLESSIGAKLVTRSAKGVDLTPVGLALLGQVHRIRLTMDEAAREAADLGRGCAGHLRIGAGPLASERLPEVYAPLLGAAPKISLSIQVSDNDVMVPALLRGELDLIVNFIPPIPYDGTLQEHLYEDEWIVCASAKHPLVRQRTVRLKDLANEGWALSVPFVRSQLWLSRVFEENGLPTPRVVVEARSLSLRLQTLATTNLLGYVQKRVLTTWGALYQLREIPIRELAWRTPNGLIYRKGGYLSPVARRFIELSKERLLA